MFEIDLLTLDSSSGESINRYHIECSISISSAFSKLTAKEFSPEKLKNGGGKAVNEELSDHLLYEFNPQNVDLLKEI